MSQHRAPLTAHRFLADPDAPELHPRFEFRFSGPAQPAASALRSRPVEYRDYPDQRYSHQEYHDSEYRNGYIPEDEFAEREAGFDPGYDHDPGYSHEPQDFHPAPEYDPELERRGFSTSHRPYSGGNDGDFDPMQERVAQFFDDPEFRVPDTAAPARRRRGGGGAHRLPAPPAALKGRAAVVAVAAGAVVAAGHSALSGAPEKSSAANTSELDMTAATTAATVAVPVSAAFTGSTTPHSDSPQVLNVAEPVSSNEYSDILQRGKKFEKDRAAREAALARPLFTPFAHGTFTSGFGVRWGVMHQGVDVAAPIGTPIYAVSDGEVIDAGPASGFGMWVRLRHADGTITVYGHVNTTTVNVGQKVMAGDQIATVGNRGYSTGPHCHFEVWQGGTTKIDPLPWLSARGVSLGPERD